MHLLSLSVSVNLSQNIAKCSFSLACDWCLMLTPSSGILIHCCLSVTDTFICRINLFNRIAPGSWQQIQSKCWPQCPASSDLRTGSINSIYQTPVDTIPAFHKFCAVPTVRRGEVPPPCKFCSRSRQQIVVQVNFWAEQWTMADQQHYKHQLIGGAAWWMEAYWASVHFGKAWKIQYCWVLLGDCCSGKKWQTVCGLVN